MILDVKFLDVSTGFVFAGSDPDIAKSHGLILKTTNGRTWRTVYTSARPFELMWKGAFPSGPRWTPAICRAWAPWTIAC